MRRRTAPFHPNAWVATVIFGAWWCCSTSGQETLDERCGTLSGRQTWVRFEICMGRIEASAWPSREARCWNELDSDQRFGDRMRVEVHGELVDLQYESLTPQGRWSLQVRRSTELQLRWTPAAAGEGDDASSVVLGPVLYEQLASGRVGFQVGADSRAPIREAASLWHLLLLWPKECRDHLAPQLAKIRDDWRMDQVLSSALDQLFLWPSTVNHAEVAQWVEALADEDFATRQRAQSLLVKSGVAVLPWLEILEQRQNWDDEQQLRVGHIRVLLAGRGPDRMERVSIWLGGDPQALLALMNDDDAQRRGMAFERFCQVSASRHDFDPQAPTAQRSEQLARMQDRIRADGASR